MPTKFGSNVDEDHRFELVVLNSNRSVRMGLRVAERSSFAVTAYGGGIDDVRRTEHRASRQVGHILGFDYPADHSKKKQLCCWLRRP
jgi:hypothetical protein